MRLLFIAILWINSALVSAQEAEFSFEQSTIKLPKTKEGEIINFEFKFTNTGKLPLIISEIKVQCTCTTFDFPKQPIQPGAQGVIKVSFDTKGKIGYQDRILEVFANTLKSPVKLRFKVMIDNPKS